MYIKPKVGDIIICIDDDSQDEDFGMSGLVLKGTKGMVVGNEYEIIEIITDRNVPKYDPTYSWTKEEYQSVAWGWNLCNVKDKNNKVFRQFLHNFKPSIQLTRDSKIEKISI